MNTKENARAELLQRIDLFNLTAENNCTIALSSKFIDLFSQIMVDYCNNVDEKYQFVPEKSCEKVVVCREITPEDFESLKIIRSYFGENDRTPLEHLAYNVLDRLLTSK